VKPFTYERVIDPRAAGPAVLRAGAKFISGGTNLLDLMKLEIEQPTHLVDISRLPLKQVEELPEGGLRIGAQATNSDVAADPRVRARRTFPARWDWRADPVSGRSTSTTPPHWHGLISQTQPTQLREGLPCLGTMTGIWSSCRTARGRYETETPSVSLQMYSPFRSPFSVSS
jgi:hypothetical protein